MAISLGGPHTAIAAPACTEQPSEVTTLLEGQGTLESVIVDRRGRLFFTDDDSLLRLDAPDARPRELTAIVDPGGLAFDDEGNVIVGYGNSAGNGTVGDAEGRSGLLRVDPRTGHSEVFATGLSMANGVVRGPDGSYYASNDFGANIDRISPGGETQRGWSQVQSGNGLVIDTAGRYLYAAQTFQPAAIQRVELADPANVTPYVVAGEEDTAAGLDGMARDGADNIFVAANGSGQIWRVGGTPPSICILLDGLPGFPDGPSAVATGVPGTDFPAENLYAVTFDGKLIELVDVAVAGAKPRPRIRLRVRPRRTSVGDPTRFRFRTTSARQRGSGRRRLARVKVRFAGERVRTNRRGRATIRASFARPGRHRARARRHGFRPDVVRVRVRR